jgi:adenylate cyclase
MQFIQGGHREQDKIEGLKHARAAVAGAGDDATALATAAMVMGHLGGEHRAAIDTIKSALAINPSSATVNYHACHIYYMSGDFAAGRLHADRALRLSPRDPLAFQAYYAYGFTALHEGRPGEAAPWFAKAAQANGGAPIRTSHRPRPWPWTAARGKGARFSSSMWAARRASIAKCSRKQE